MESGKEREHFLALKVMRLTKPTMMVSHPVTCDQRDLPASTLNEISARDLATDRETPFFGLGELLTLPQNFGNIFLGETFSSYISVHNDSNQLCKEILVKTDLQTSSQRLSLTSAHSEAVSELQPDCSIDDIIHHEVKELGTHILVCAVSYTTQSGEKLYFRKFFKFQVLKPLDVKTKFYNSEDYVSDEVFLEAQIQNITPGPIYVESINLDPSMYYSAAELNTSGGKNSNEPVFGSINYINPLDSRQYLYCLTPKSEMYTENKVMKGVTTIGKLDIVWRTNLGEVGRLQTSQLQRVAPGYGDIRLSVQAIPDAVEIEKPFNVTCRITNCCEREMDLLLVLQNTNKIGLVWYGISGKQLGKLQPNSSLDLPLTLIPISPGLQTISGVRLTDSFLKRTYELDEIAQIFVYDPEIE